MAKPKNIVADPSAFFGWWQWRSYPRAIDREIIQEAVAAGLVNALSGMLALTERGKARRDAGMTCRKNEAYAGCQADLVVS